MPTASHIVVLLSRTKEGLTADSAHIQHMIRVIQKLSEEMASGKEARHNNFLTNEFKLMDNERAMFDCFDKTIISIDTLKRDVRLPAVHRQA